LAEGARLLDTLKDGDSLLIAEACSHHVRCDDIGRVKIPRWLKDYTGKELNLTIAAGHDFPDDLEKFSLVIHCGGCMLTATEMKRRMRQCLARGVPVTNYGVAISKMHGVLDRIVRPFGL
jgi:predicted GTPase